MAGLNTQNDVLGSDYLIFLIGVLMRWCIGLHSYSGENTPPVFGDYEAQRHWMEITYNLQLQDWYKNTIDNDLNYWGLDYPPLTAYHSYICGLIASYVIPQSVKLNSSRGYESYDHKLFMRSTVFVSDLVLYIPAIFWYFRTFRKHKDLFSSNLCFLFTLIYPGLILIDHGHFQYNCVSLGFFIVAVTSVLTQHFKTAALFFCLAVNYKQMELYHSLPFFFFFLGKFLFFIKKKNFFFALKFIIQIGTVVLGTFLMIWFPFLLNISDAKQILHRIFPVARGVFEDKVSSFWCVLNIIYKMQEKIDNEAMLRICFFVTLFAVLPSVIDLMFNPSCEKFKLSLIINSISFFLFSYHVHEKSILLAAVPVALDFPHNPIFSFWFLSISTFSMLPLLIADRLYLPFLALFAFYVLCWLIFLNKRSIYILSVGNINIKVCLKTLVNFSLLGCTILALLAKVCSPPLRYPYLWALLISCYSFIHFFGFLLYYYFKQCGSWFIKKKKC